MFRLIFLVYRINYDFIVDSCLLVYSCRTPFVLCLEVDILQSWRRTRIRTRTQDKQTKKYLNKKKSLKSPSGHHLKMCIVQNKNQSHHRQNYTMIQNISNTVFCICDRDLMFHVPSVNYDGECIMVSGWNLVLHRNTLGEMSVHDKTHTPKGWFSIFK